RLAARLRPQWLGIAAVLFLAVASVNLVVIAPKILGHTTNIIVRGVYTGTGIDYSQLHRVLLTALAVYVSSAMLSFLQSYLLAGVVQRAMYRLRSNVE